MQLKLILSNLKLLIVIVLVSAAVALLYLVFEAAIRNSTEFVWNTLFQADTYRYMVFPIAIGIGLIFFWLQHALTGESSSEEEHGTPKPTLKNLGVVLLLGFFSLLAGASLGPEAILVPASIIIGGYIGSKLLARNKKAAGLMAGVAIIALMAAFFNSFFIGLLSLLLVSNQLKTPINIKLVIIAVIASAGSYATLQIIEPSSRFFNFPAITWEAVVMDIIASVLLLVLGFMATFGLKYAHGAVEKIRSSARLNTWWKQGLVASASIGLIYFIGGPLIQFTGNESIAPLAEQASSLGILVIIGILIMKIIAIAWSKAMGYRGGLIFPMVFVASSLVLIVLQLLPAAHFGVGLIAALVGILAAETRAKVLFD